MCIRDRDKPDLQSEDNSVGIEIVQSVREEDMKLRSLACEYWTNKANDNSRILRAMKKNGWNDNTIKDLDAGILYYKGDNNNGGYSFCLLYTSPSPRDRQKSRMPSSA